MTDREQDLRQRLRALADDPRTPIARRVEALKVLDRFPAPEPVDQEAAARAEAEDYRHRRNGWAALDEPPWFELRG